MWLKDIINNIKKVRGWDMMFEQYDTFKRIGAIDYIKKNEALRLDLYKCTADKWTIGYGRNIEDIGITEQEANILLHNDIMRCEKELVRVFGKAFMLEMLEMDKSRYVVLLDMMFNLGFSRFNSFKKMINAVKVGNYKQAAEEIKDSKYYNQVGNRSEKNYNIMLTGNF